MSADRSATGAHPTVTHTGPSVAVVTGAARGIGAATAEALARDGHHVVLADRDPYGARAAAERIRAWGGVAVAEQVDIAEGDSLDALLASVESTFGGLDVMVNNAGVTRRIPFDEITEGDWHDIVDVNAKGTFFATQKAAAALRRRGGGRIVNIASIAGKGYPGTSNAAYAASKGAIIALTRVASTLLGRDGITVNAVCPGITRTALTAEANLAAAGGDSVEELERSFTIPLGRANEPADVAAAVAFLASPAARTITGQSINVDGGLVFD